MVEPPLTVASSKTAQLTGHASEKSHPRRACIFRHRLWVRRWQKSTCADFLHPESRPRQPCKPENKRKTRGGIDQQEEIQFGTVIALSSVGFNKYKYIVHVTKDKVMRAKPESVTSNPKTLEPRASRSIRFLRAATLAMILTALGAWLGFC